MIRIFLFFFCCFCYQAEAQYISGKTYPDPSIQIIEDPSLPEVKFSKELNKEDVKVHLEILASDEYEGRETGEKGNDMAAEYISKYFKSIGLQSKNNSYYQDVAFTSSLWDSIKCKVNGNEYKFMWDFLAIPSMNENAPNFKTDEVLYLGYGIGDKRYNDYKGVNVKGKSILIYEGEPRNKNNISQVTKTEAESGWTNEKKLEYAQKKGVKMVFIIEDDIKQRLAENRRKIIGGEMELGDKRKEKNTLANHMYISSTVAKDMMGSKLKKVIKSRDKSKSKGKTKRVELKTDVKLNLSKIQNVLVSQNVYGFIEGTDKKDEWVVVSAHYDHLGKRGETSIFNGADDNGSGTSTVLDLAQAFQAATENDFRPKRSILFLLCTGEEKGLLGSEYYAANPLFPLENTMVDVNIDMIGRVDKEHENDPNYIYVIGSDRLSTTLHEINEDVNQKYTQLMLDYTFNDINDPNRYYDRSDHYNFAKNGIPSVFFFSGVHKDYHRTTDTVEKIMFDKMEKIGRHAFHLIWELANREESIEVNVDIEKP